MHDFDLLIARSTQELEHMLADSHGSLLAGGTDLILSMEMGRKRPATVIDISRLDNLHFVRADDRVFRLGPLVTHSEIVHSPLLQEWAPILPMAASTIGAPQIRNRGTIGGNLGTASPAGDIIPALMALEAGVTLRSVRGVRRVVLEEFFVGPGKTSMAADEYISEIAFPTPPAGASGVYYKAGRRKAQAISLVSVGAQVVPDHGRGSLVRLSLGAVAPTVIRASAAEASLRGQALTADACRHAAQIAAREAVPIDDIRASASYRRKLIEIWVRRALEVYMEV